MPNFPKLKAKGLGWDDSGEIRDFEQARYFPFSQGLVIVVEDQVVESYEDIIRRVDQDRFKEKELLEVKFLPIIVGG